MLPFVEVVHLPSAASFYAAITQPLGLRYIAADASSITYGAPSTDPLPVFEARRVDQDAGPPRLSRLVLSAPSAVAVSDFHAAALRANPGLLIGGETSSVLDPPRHHLHTSVDGGDARAEVADLDGNIMEVVYIPPPDYPSHHSGSTVRRTHSTTPEVSRILDWNFDVATSHPQSQRAVARPGPSGAPTALARRPASVIDDEPAYTTIRRSVTTSTIEPGPQQRSSGLSPGAVAGTLLGAVAVGAAVGGAITYSMMKNERARAPVQEFDAPAFQRRATFPDPYPDRSGSRYIEVERTVEKIRYPEDYALSSKRYPPPSYLARYSQAGAPRSREVEEVFDDGASRRSSRHSAASARTRTRSEASGSRRPLMITDGEHRSSVGSRYGGSHKLLTETEHRSVTGSRHTSSPRAVPDGDYHSQASSRHTGPRLRHREPEVETWVSARSHRSGTTIRPPTRSRPEDRYLPAPPRVSSRAQSYVSARDVPLPPSRVGSVLDDDDAESLAPSDSISNVGSRRSGRTHH